MNIDNAAIGVNEGSLSLNAISYPYIENYLQSVGVPENFHLTVLLKILQGLGVLLMLKNIKYQYHRSRDFKHIDATNGTYNWGETIKGSYEGTLYFLSSIPEGFTIPVPIRIQFSALDWPNSN